MLIRNSSMGNFSFPMEAAFLGLDKVYLNLFVSVLLDTMKQRSGQMQREYVFRLHRSYSVLLHKAKLGIALPPKV